ncbi:hypothetical protein NEIFLAOT_02473 [Neisseria flavescens NRL30031/H210]|uniref:Uncharacterized protein n=1 Tax=Neisseria flavescens NRL30031/H210 TaxID=546264 RepID=C0ER74_NEIFL|nr:hypothetical protein NEIFLAOT_02473 [Neisseria flavescens NRL30031/H210]
MKANIVLCLFNKYLTDFSITGRLKPDFQTACLLFYKNSFSETATLSLKYIELLKLNIFK